MPETYHVLDPRVCLGFNEEFDDAGTTSDERNGQRRVPILTDTISRNDGSSSRV
jgi:hypothetical protein